MKVRGMYVQVFLTEDLYEHYRGVAEKQHLSVPSVIRDLVIDASPAAVRQQARAIVKPGQRLGNCVALDTAPHKAARAKTPEDDSEARFAELVNEYRARVLDLARRKWTQNTISAFLRIPYRVTQHIIAEHEKTTKAKRRGRK